jgi:hypothetical protein
LRLTWQASLGQQTLYKREGDGGPRLAQLVGADEPGGPSGSTGRARPFTTPPHSGIAVTGAWQWELKSVDAEGDERQEREVWHLTETDGEVSGWYERTVLRQRIGGNFPCSGEPRIETATRFEIQGHRFGDYVTLTEVSFKARKNQCDNGLRRLDTYQGSVTGAGDELILSWGSGNQVLRRLPDAPVARAARID